MKVSYTHVETVIFMQHNRKSSAKNISIKTSFIRVLNVTIREELSHILLTTNRLFMKASDTLVTSVTI